MIKGINLLLSSKLFIFVLVLNFSVNVQSQIPVTGIEIVLDSLEIVEGFEAMLTATVFPSDADNKDI
ncbi:hypothetical protein, partial [Zobellia nedashkovskayae]